MQRPLPQHHCKNLLEAVLRLTLQIRRCLNSHCPQVRKPYRPEAEGRLALPKHECSLDVSFREDDCRIRQGHDAQNMVVLRHMALNLLRRGGGHKRGIKARRKRAGWDRDYLFQVFTG